jgi:hypothetical protein
MTAWMTAIGELASPASRARGAAGVASTSASSSASYEPASVARTVALPGADQVVAVLTQMVLPLAA